MLIPKAVTLADELPRGAIGDEPYWSENYCFFGHDHASNVGIYLHFGRWAQDRTIWREQVYVFLPDGTSLNYRSLGRGDTSEGPGAGLSKIRCVVPGEQWRFEFAGPCLHLTPQDMLAGPIPERLFTVMDIRMDIRAAGPAMMFDIADNSTIGRWHYEQEVELDGSVVFAGTTHPIRGNGWRDHTRGPRYLPHLAGHVNMSGKLPDGGFFSCFVLWERHDGAEVNTVSEGRIIRDGKFIAAKPSNVVRLQDPAAYGDDVSLTLTAASERIELVGKVRNTIAISCSKTFEFVYGVAPAIAPLTSLLQPTLYAVNGQEAFGFSERSIWLGAS